MQIWQRTRRGLWFLCLNDSELSYLCDDVMITPHQSCTDWLCCRIICWLNSAHVGPHTGPQPYRGTKPLFQIASTQSSVVQGREGTYCPLRTLPHSFEEQPSLIINRHTKRWAPNNTEQIPLCVQVLNISATTVCPPPLPLLFRYLHISERCGGHKRYSQLSFSPHSVKQANFKAFICAKPLINSAHAASLSLPLLKYWVL